MLKTISRCRTNILSVTRRFFHDEFSDPPSKPPPQLQKFQVFRDTDAQVILDVEEERQSAAHALETAAKPLPDIDINLERGLTGVFEIEDLVHVLKKDHGRDICVCKVPDAINYVDYICSVTGRNHRHMVGMAEYVRKLYKMKRHKGDLLPKIEGVGSRDWIALDLGNIALHIFSEKARIRYDIDQLWALGAEHDTEANKVDESIANLEKYSIFLEDLKPKMDG